MQCNIDQRGRQIRLIGGLIMDLAGTGVIALTLFDLLPWWGWIVGLALILGGAFTIFESLKGWCVVRAMGIKTPV